jgi:hypothetical protein
LLGAESKKCLFFGGEGGLCHFNEGVETYIPPTMNPSTTRRTSKEVKRVLGVYTLQKKESSLQHIIYRYAYMGGNARTIVKRVDITLNLGK